MITAGINAFTHTVWPWKIPLSAVFLLVGIYIIYTTRFKIPATVKKDQTDEGDN